MKKIYVCNDSEEGIFSAIYDAWKTGLGEEMLGIALKGAVEPEFFCEYVEVQESHKKMVAVQNLIRRHLGKDASWNIYHAILSQDTQKADAILGMMLAAKCIADSRKIMGHLSHPKVQKVFTLGRKVANEAHYYVECVRFAEWEDGILFSEIEPKNCILSCIANHFENRFPLENWIIFDKTHNMALVHEKGKLCIIAHELGQDLTKKGEASEHDSVYTKLWKVFFESIAIKERENKKLQRQNLPIYFREHMTEFKQHT